jgi:2-polyprenyl-3-methyl-5-hydroxy-6-metoxy-1,4-benzoquinol methylase
MKRSAIARVRSKLMQRARRIPSTEGYAEDPQHYWNRRHAAFGTKLEGVGRIYLGEDANAAEYKAKWERIGGVLEGLRAHGAVTLLDAGCGNGYFSERAAKLGYRVEGVDFSEKAITAARSVPGRDAIAWRVAPLDEYRSTTTFDVVMSIDVLFHVVDDDMWRRILTNLTALVSPRGALLIQEQLVDGRVQSSDVRHVRRRSLREYEAACIGLRLVRRDSYVLDESGAHKDLLLLRGAD